MANLADKLDFLPIAHALNFFLIFLLFFKFWSPNMISKSPLMHNADPGGGVGGGWRETIRRGDKR